MENELYHYGILGQKWGKRNGPPYPLSNSQKSQSERTSYKVNPKILKKEMDYMADAELQRAINRVNMQNQVSKMNPSLIEKGEKELKRIRDDLGLITGTAAAVTATSVLIKKLL